MNKVLSRVELDSIGFPATDLSQWRLLVSCNSQMGAVCNDTLADVNRPGVECSKGTLPPGTYLFVSLYKASPSEPEFISAARIALFDRSVGYKIVHGTSIYGVFVDVKNAIFGSWTHRHYFSPGCVWNEGVNESKVNGLGAAPWSISIYKI